VARTMFEYTPVRVWAAAKPWVLDIRRSVPGYGRFFERFAETQAPP
jgi:hypothetical protein